jgi:outer membrane protein OmpA-like peptidoglycan-associated protein
MDSTGHWTKPKNLGYPINTEEDEVGFFVSTDGKTGYFSSNRLGRGDYDIYSFELYPEVRPEKVLFVSGRVMDEEDNEPVNAIIELENTVTKAVTRVKVDSVTGKYASVVRFDNDYLLTVKKEGYAFQSSYISSKDSTFEEPARVDLPVKRVEVGGQYRLNDILFATNSSEINDTIKVVLDNFSKFLLEYPNLKVSINGHTDNVGDPKSNLALSESRARTVYQYLQSKSIAASRLSYKGFGETQPVTGNDSEAGRARNRRTVFVVMSKD